VTGSHPLVSIIIPAFNAGTFLAAALDSLLLQSYEHIEIVIVDDGSSDDTAAIGARYAEASSRVRLVALSPNRGVAKAREAAVVASHGDYLWFVDADDQWSDDAVQVMLSAATSSAADVVVAGAEYVFTNGSVKPVGAVLPSEPMSGESAFRLFLTGDVTGHLWNKLFRGSLARSIRFTPAQVHSDQAMVAQLIAGATSVVAIEAVVYRYVLRAGSIIRSGTPRLESLQLVAAAVETAARQCQPRLLDSREYRYYRLWFLALSSLKDATSGVYAGPQAAQHLASARQQITLGGLVLLARRRDLKRLVLAGSAKISVPLYRRVVSRANARS
jgi:glycosyltransferase involved in cell wall biosynthesis